MPQPSRASYKPGIRMKKEGSVNLLTLGAFCQTDMDSRDGNQQTAFSRVIISENFTGAAAASRLYVDAITKLARQAQQGTWGGSSDIGKFLAEFDLS